ncbi:HH [Lepeophtheirus salmonis]|uniref:Protein hedgehog n=1 Tax=Lepeophtheirus salmonis TaxID=72036 RepID=A0A7R8H6M9_LEPSM|nr:HH [Lepeophtheirus salmonis]CAF2892054.1 HH [Lepeophtheirus salmonis]
MAATKGLTQFILLVKAVALEGEAYDEEVHGSSLPLVYKQHVPNFSEISLAASGLNKEAVGRSSPEFRRLVPNYNPDIYFKDDEETGADRLMTQRCKEKLNTLAISVMNQWPGIRLRVIEGWDEDKHHSHHSLHYEGRALDLTTSDRDRRKYGLLARLAVESGFDWVYYESRAHIHASCKDESANPTKNGGGCFEGTGLVMTDKGERKALNSLDIGESVLSINANGDFEFSPVIMFLHKDPNELRKFLLISTSSGHSLKVTPSHLLINSLDLNSTSRANLEYSTITDISVVYEKGVFAPLTKNGNIFVNGVFARVAMLLLTLSLWLILHSCP